MIYLRNRIQAFDDYLRSGFQDFDDYLNNDGLQDIIRDEGI